MKGIDKSFPGVQALKDAGLELYEGEVLALVGENGAGKSTLIKILCGAHVPDAGTVHIEGAKHEITCPLDGQRAGIAVIYQELNLVGALTVRENVFLGRDESRFGFIRHAAERNRARELFGGMEAKIDPDSLCRDLPLSQQQLVENLAKLLPDDTVLILEDVCLWLIDLGDALDSKQMGHVISSVFSFLAECGSSITDEGRWWPPHIFN
ncbi:MAG: ATP-binding cassette domain-containing protein [Planctomycetota bacterium]